MCGRFTREYTWSEIVAYYRLIGSAPSNLQPRYNICPTTQIDVVSRDDDDGLALVPMRWGLVPGWWKKPLKEMRMATFNAKAERIATAPMFREAFRQRRCLIPASGYYEWRAEPGGKQPYYFTRRDRGVITIAGIHDAWTDPQTGAIIKSCAMVITNANGFVGQYHDRMPVILEADDFERWEQGSTEDAAALMRPAGDDILQARPVSRRVNSSRAPDDDASLIAPVDEPPRAVAGALL